MEEVIKKMYGIEKFYYIKCNERNKWWKPNRNGYTDKLSEAGVYLESEAKEITSQPFVKDTMHEV